MARSNRRRTTKKDTSGGESGDADATAMDETMMPGAATTAPKTSEPLTSTTSQQQQEPRKWKKKKSSNHSSSSFASNNRERNLLKHYLQEYKDRMYAYYHHLTPSTTKTLLPLSSSSAAPIVIFGSEFPRLDDPVLLEKPYLSLPSTLDGRCRRQAHALCEELGMFHVGVQVQDDVDGSGSGGDRYIAISVFHDGLALVPGIDEDPAVQKKLASFSPWFQWNDIDIVQCTKEGIEQIYELVDQPGKCLRDGIDQVDLVAMEGVELGSTTTPKAQDDSWKWIQSKDDLHRCIEELTTNKPKELAFDLEALCRSKIQQLTCLIQLATDDGREYIIDVLADGVWDEVQGLAPIFADKSVVKVGHGVIGVDVPSLHRDFGIFIVNLFDTMEAARVLNFKEKGLASVCARYNLPNCEVYNSLKEEYQMADWTKRPLTDPMILYGRYDVHYLLQLRKLMMRDLVKLPFRAGAASEAPNESECDALRDMIRKLNEEDGIDDEEDSFVDTIQSYDDEIEKNDDEAKQSGAASSLQAKDLRMNLDLMQVLSSSQNKCLSVWTGKSDDHWKNAEYLAVTKQNKKDRKEWSSSQRQLYDELVEWRDVVSSKYGILSGFVCGTDFLVKLVQYRPTSKYGIRQINYFLTSPLKEHIGEILLLIQKSRKADGLSNVDTFTSFKTSQKQRIFRLLSFLEKSSTGSNTWFYWMSLVVAIATTAAFVKMRRRISFFLSPTKTSFVYSSVSARSRWVVRLWILSSICRTVTSLSHQEKLDDASKLSRRNFGQTAFQCAIVFSGTTLVSPTCAASATGSLAERLSKKDPDLLANSVFNLPPPAQVYPPFMRGKWDVTLKYGGYLFPSQKIPRERLTADAQIPGFQKCSIAALSDVGKESVKYAFEVDRDTGLEDRNTTLTTSISAHLGYPAVQQVLYNPKANANRLSIVFYEYRTTNAERIELFCNGRESELVQRVEANGDARQIFVCSEYIRQVTFGTGSQVGIPRQVGTNYAHFWTWKETPNDPDTLTGNLLTAGYLDPQDSLFFEEPSKPVAVYSHIITAKRIG